MEAHKTNEATGIGTPVIDEPISTSDAEPGTMSGFRRAPRNLSLMGLAERFGLLAIIVVLVVLFSLLNSTFTSSANWQAIISSQAVNLVIALALIVPLIAGNFDLSVGSVAILSSIVVSGAEQNNHSVLVVACVLGILSGTIVGVINAVLVVNLRLNSLIATIGTSTIVAGLITEYTGGNSIVNGISTSLTNFGSGNTLGVPRIAIAAVVGAVVIAYVLGKTPYGRKLFAIGSSQPAAELVGIRVGRVVFASFLISGTLAGIGGVLLLAQQGSGNPAAAGLSVLLPALAAVYLGASTLFPGQFNVPGTVLGLLLVGVLVSGLTLEGAAAWVQPVAIGGSLLIAVGASEAFRRQRR